MKIPKLQSTISALVSQAQVLSSIPPDEVISIGCAKQSAYLTGSDDLANDVDIEITTIQDDITFQYVDADNKPIENSEPELLFKSGAPVPSIHGVTLAKPMKHPVKLAIQQGEHIDYIEESDPNLDLTEISARLHGGIRKLHDKYNIEPATIHLHLN